MGWFRKSEDSSPSDPLASLDPKLRDFLLQQSPLKPGSTATTTTATSTHDPSSSSNSRKVLAPESTPEPTSQNPRTRNSKYGDRYADIWEQYTPQGITEASKSSQEQLADILQAYKYRKSLIGRAALENCSNEQWILQDCYNNGSLAQRMTVCSSENRSLQDCYTTQTKFLQAMGYMSDFSRSPEVDERIQMHADKLYQERLRQDKEANAEKKAKKLQRETMAPGS